MGKFEEVVKEDLEKKMNNKTSNDDFDVFTGLVENLLKGKDFTIISTNLLISLDSIKCGVEVDGKGMFVAEVVHNMDKDFIVQQFEPVRKSMEEYAMVLSAHLKDRNPNVKDTIIVDEPYRKEINKEIN